MAYGMNFHILYLLESLSSLQWERDRYLRSQVVQLYKDVFHLGEGTNVAFE
ncbi:hypothetical protein FRB94_014538 [Tulasnella sp. JGI-2019a]|nr:hypothetical protein FRB94_014538 [Tulasnella sp. JGI-2019a]KAG8995296.1 hypothetical protein FRB93_001190 [Tulasnella sp. JGI-2019a]